MKFTPNSISIFILTIFLVLGSLVLSTNKARAGTNICFIDIMKAADPADDTEFEFTAPGNFDSTFTLMDPSDNSIELFFFFNQQVTVTEIVPPGWRLEDMVCDEPVFIDVGPFVNNGRTFTCLGQDFNEGRVSCTFINTNSCSVTVQKTANPPDDTEFDFTAPGSDNPSFTLMDPSDSSIDIEFGVDQNVTVTEEIPSGWQLDGIECTDTPGIIVTETPNGVNLECDFAAETVCNFTNSIAPRPIPTLSEWGLLVTAAVLALLGLLALRRRKVTS